MDVETGALALNNLARATDGLSGHGLVGFGALYCEDCVVASGLARVAAGGADASDNVIDFDVEGVAGVGVDGMIAQLTGLFDVGALELDESEMGIDAIHID